MGQGDSSMTDKEKCISCGHQCCRFCGFMTAEMSGRSLEYYIARGCKVLKAMIADGEIYRVYVPAVCPHLVEGEGCSIYERRPLSCIEYEGRLDPLTQDVCQIKEG